MTVKAVTYYTVECDYRDCGVDLSDLGGEYSAWADGGAAVDDWISNDGIVTDNGLAFCHEHAKGMTCDHCSEIAETIEDADGDRICAVCHREVSGTTRGGQPPDSPTLFGEASS